jgi:predicted GTPase
VTTSAPSGSGETELQEAIDEAVRVSKATFASLRAQTERLLWQFSAEPPVPGRADSSEPDVHRLIAAELELNEKLADELRSVFDRQAATIGQFSIVVFGRTGTGKSSLIEAMTRGNGESISPDGLSDYTSRTHRVRWSSCVLIDSPGTAGPSERRAALEAEAHQAVQVADVVLLCFDSQNQQVEEFAQVAAWVRDYGKPLVVVFNVRGPAWRNPVRAVTGRHRAKLTSDVANQAGRIREGLDKLGLPGTVIVAISSQRAVFARCRQYSGPQQAERASLLARHGDTKLLAWSHYPVLERLLKTAITRDAVRLRLGMLSNQAVGALRKARDGLETSLRIPADDYATAVEAGIEPLLRELGRPAGRVQAGLRAAIEQLETARGQEFDVPAVGAIRVIARAKIRSALAPRRERTREKAVHAVEHAIAKRQILSTAQFAGQAYDKTADEDAIKGASAAISAHIKTVFTESAEAMKFALDQIDPEGTDVPGRTGVGKKRLGYLGGGTATLGTAATPTVTAAIAVVSLTPVVVVLLGAVVLAGFLSLAGQARRMRRHAELTRQQAVALARGRAEGGVTRYYDHIEHELMKQVDRLIASQLNATVGPLVHRARLLRDIELRAATRLGYVRQVLAVLEPRQASPTALFAAAATSCVPGDYPLGAENYWLGAEWCDDPEGLVSPARAAQPPDSSPTADDIPSLARPKPNRDSLPSLLSLLRRPRRGSGRDWLVRAHAVLDEDPAAVGALAELDNLAADPRLRIAVIGDYNAGKTSLLRRLFAEAGLPVPAGLTVDSVPETAEVHAYPWADVLLLDTPGLHSGIPEHDAIALEAVSDAAVVVYVLAPTRSQESDYFVRVLHGDPSLSLPGKLDRTLFLINRGDEFGADPEDNPRGFQELADAKVRELTELLARLGRPPKPGQIKVVATAPDAVVVWTRDDVRRYRDWDGVEAAVASLASLIRLAAPTAPDVALLHGGLARVGALAVREENAKTALDASVRRQQNLVRGAEEGADAGRALIASQFRRLRDAVFTVVATVLDTIANTLDEDVRFAATERLAKWWEEPQIDAALLNWRDQCRVDVEEWWETVIPREAAPHSTEKTRAARADGTGIDLAGLRRGMHRESADLGMKAAHSVRAALVMAEFEVGYLLGPVLAVIEAVRMVREHRADQRLAAEVTRARARIFEVCGKWAQAIVGDEVRPGELEPVRLGCAELDREAARQRKPLDKLEHDRRVVVHRLEVYRDLIAKANKQL